MCVNDGPTKKRMYIYIHIMSIYGVIIEPRGYYRNNNFLTTPKPGYRGNKTPCVHFTAEALDTNFFFFFLNYPLIFVNYFI